MILIRLVLIAKGRERGQEGILAGGEVVVAVGGPAAVVEGPVLQVEVVDPRSAEFALKSEFLPESLPQPLELPALRVVAVEQRTDRVRNVVDHQVEAADSGLGDLDLEEVTVPRGEDLSLDRSVQSQGRCGLNVGVGLEVVAGGLIVHAHGVGKVRGILLRIVVVRPA